MKTGRGHRGEIAKVKGVASGESGCVHTSPCHCGVGGSGQAPPRLPTCHMVVIIGLQAGERERGDVLSVVSHLVITGSVNTRELSLYAFVVVAEVVVGWVGFEEPVVGAVGAA